MASDAVSSLMSTGVMRVAFRINQALSAEQVAQLEDRGVRVDAYPEGITGQIDVTTRTHARSSTVTSAEFPEALAIAKVADAVAGIGISWDKSSLDIQQVI